MHAKVIKGLILAGALLLPVFLWAAPGSVNYEYDTAGRLRKTTFPEGTKSDYVLDAAGNRTTVASTLGAGLITLSVASSVSEAAGSLTVTVARSGSANGAISVNYATSNGTAAAGSDYTAISGGTLNWANGDSANKSFLVTIANDGNYEAAETFVLTLSNPTNGAILGSPSQATVTIANDDTAPAFAISSALSVGEAAGSVTVTVTKTGSTVLSHAVNYATANSTAASGSDYTVTSGTLTFATNETSKTFTIPIINNSVYEGSETFSVNLSVPTNGAIVSAATGIITITEDDPGPSFSINGNWNYENGGSIVFTVTKTGSTAVAHSVSYYTGDWDTAVANSDYWATSGTLTFQAAETTKTITVSLINNDIPEPSEWFYVALNNATNGATINGSYWYGTGGIADDEVQDTVTVATTTSYYFDSYQSAVYYGAYNTSAFSPTQMTGGATYKSWYQWTTWYNSGGSFGPVNWLAIQIPYDPGKNWLISIAVAGVTNTGASAYNYYYNPATQIAEWYWNGNIFSTANPVATVIHH